MTNSIRAPFGRFYFLSLALHACVFPFALFFQILPLKICKSPSLVRHRLNQPLRHLHSIIIIMPNVWANPENITALLMSMIDDIDSVPVAKFEVAAARIGGSVTASACRYVTRPDLCFAAPSNFLSLSFSLLLVRATPQLLSYVLSSTSCFATTSTRTCRATERKTCNCYCEFSTSRSSSTGMSLTRPEGPWVSPSIRCGEFLLVATALPCLSPSS